MMQPTKTETRRDQIIQFIAEYAISHHNAPSTIEIAKALHVGRSTVDRGIVRLIAEGRLTKIDGHLKIPDVKLPSGIIKLPPSQPKSGLYLTSIRKPYRQDHDFVRMMYRQQGGNCWWCQKSLDGIYELDHRIPLAKGGPDTPENICLAHPECNREKSDQMPGEYMEGRLL